MKIAIIGSAGVPARYGGFETLAENLARFHSEVHPGDELVVYCSAKDSEARIGQFCAARLNYVPLSANGFSSILYDGISLWRALFSGADIVLALGVSGAVFFPIRLLFPKTRLICNVDGVEWRREKWNFAARNFLRFSESVAFRLADTLVADNAALQLFLEDRYHICPELITYGGDHVDIEAEGLPSLKDVPKRYALALCRVEPENNVRLILETFASLVSLPLIFVGNWDNSDYSRELLVEFGQVDGLHLVPPVYEANELGRLRNSASVYIHGHSAGGTNPSLVEAMHHALPIVAWDCEFNRSTTKDLALFFHDKDSLKSAVRFADDDEAGSLGIKLQELAQREYTWNAIGECYFNLFRELNRSVKKS